MKTALATKPKGGAPVAGYSERTYRPVKLSYTHDALIDLIVAEPDLTQKELAARFGRTFAWVNIVINSEMFQAALAKRRAEIVDPFLIASVEERLQGLAMQATEIIAEKLEKTRSFDHAMKALELSVKATDFGAKGPVVSNNFVVQLPPKAESSEDWSLKYAKGTKNVQLEQ